MDGSMFQGLGRAIIVAMIVTASFGVGIGYALQRMFATPARTLNPDGTAQLVIDNDKLLIAIAFAQKPNGHVDPIRADANGYVLCAPAPPTPQP